MIGAADGDGCRRPSVPPSGTTGSATRPRPGRSPPAPDASGRSRSRSGGRSFGGALGWIARLGHEAGRTSGFGTSASPTWCNSSWYEPVKARRVRAVGPNVSNSSAAQAVGLERPHEIREPRAQLVDDGRVDRLVHPRPDLDRRGVEAALPDGRHGDDDVAPDQLRPVEVVPDRGTQQSGPQPALPGTRVGPLEDRDARPRQGGRIGDDPVPLGLDTQPVLERGPSSG